MQIMLQGGEARQVHVDGHGGEGGERPQGENALQRAGLGHAAHCRSAATLLLRLTLAGCDQCEAMARRNSLTCSAETGSAALPQLVRM
ncbi:hypothetical protein THICB3310032 [Thiomonas sp. CB3]|nr:hypothetical protein THICB3310032 [Thiomonas sp. CB3]